MTTPLDEKGLLAAAKAHDHWVGDERTIGAMNARRNAEEVIRAYLSTTPAPDGLEVVAWECTDLIMGGEPSVITDVDHAGARKRQPKAWQVEELVRRSQAQSALAAVMKEIEQAWAAMGRTEIEGQSLVGRIIQERVRTAKATAAAEAEVKRLTEENEQLREAIATPEAVHANMLRGGIPKLSIRQALHLHGAEALEKWDGIETSEARIKALTEENEAACNDLRRFMTSFVREHFPENKGWKPLPDLIGMLTQMDNASTIARDYKARIKALEEALGNALACGLPDVVANAALATLNSREKVDG